MPAGVEVAYFTIAERTLFWLNSLLTGHGPEQVASRLEKYRSAHHCEITVEAEEGISLEWLKEDYEIARVECFSREQESPCKLQFSYSCKPSNFGGLLEGVVVLQVLAESKPSSEVAGSEPQTAQKLSIAGQATASERAAEALPSELADAEQDAGKETPLGQPVAVENSSITSDVPKGPSSEAAVPRQLRSFAPPAARWPAAPAAQAPATVMPVQRPGAAVQKPDAALVSKFWRELWQRCFPVRRQPNLHTTQPTPMPSPVPTSVTKPPESTVPLWVPKSNGCAARKPANDTRGHALEAPRPQCDGSSPDIGSRAALVVDPVATGSSSEQASRSQVHDASDCRVQDVATGIRPESTKDAAHTVRSLPPSASPAAEEKISTRKGHCAIYFSVDPLTGGNRFGVCCTDDTARHEPSVASGSSGDGPWWTVCTRRGGKVDRRPSKVASWRAAAAGTDVELRRTRTIFGAHERMPLRREDCMGISVSAEMTSCMDATFKVKLKHSEMPASCVTVPSCTVVAKTASEGPRGLESPSHVMERSAADAPVQPEAVSVDIVPQCALLEREVEPGPALLAQDVTADEVILDVKPAAETAFLARDMTADEVILNVKPAAETASTAEAASPHLVPEEMLIPDAESRTPSAQALVSRTVADDGPEALADINATQVAPGPHSGGPEPGGNDAKIIQSSLPHPWAALQAPVQLSSSLNQLVWQVSPPTPAAIADISQKPSEDTAKRQPLGATLLAVASMPPTAAPRRNEVAINEVQVSVPNGSMAPVLIPEQVVMACA